MSERNKHGSVSGLPIRKPRKIPVMAPTVRSQSGCSTDTENNNQFSRGQTGSSRNRLGNRMKKLILPECKQNTVGSKNPTGPKSRALENEISKSTPDLSGTTRAIRPTHITSVLTVSNKLQKINSWENMTGPVRARNASVLEKTKTKPSTGTTTKTLTVARFISANDLNKKPKRIEVSKKVGPDKNRVQKAVENKRKFGCLDAVSGHSKQKIANTELSSTASYPVSLSPPKNRMEECTKIVKKIMLDKKMVDMGERKRNSSEFEDSIGTFNSDEIVELLLNDSQLRHLDAMKASNEIDKSSKRNSSEFDDSIGSFFSDQMVFNLSKSTEFLNFAGSKQGFLNENPLGLSMSEDLDNLTPGLSELSNAIDRTPSAEDLPMECEPESESVNSTMPAPDASARSASPNEELPQESLSSRTPNAPVSIITSITSIMSLDTGYQGDGELSRPESRNTENESRLLKLPIIENGIPVKAINFDDGKTMTDSDFFTESDADAHDDLSAAAAEIGSGKGDRKAQVIDGTLYGGAFIQAHHTITNHHDHEPSSNAPDHVTNRMVGNNSNEDMESSGIYSDFEKKPEEVPFKEKEPISYLGLITEQMKTIQSLALSVAERKLKQEAPVEGIVKSSSAESSSTVHEVLSSVKATSPVTRNAEKSSLDRKDSGGKKSKMPNRNVGSKIKAIIETPVKDTTEPRAKTVKKGKWDAVMDKIAQGKEENKYTPSKFRDIKSKVFQNMGPLFNSRKNEADVKTPSKVSPSSMSKARSRRSTRIRSSESSLVSPKSKQSRTSASPNSSHRSSLSDISLTGNHHQKSANRSNKKRDSISPQSNESTNSTNTPTRKLNNNDDSISTANRGTPHRNSDLQNGNVIRTPSATGLATMKTPSIRKTPTPRRNETVGPNLHRTASVPLKDSNHNGIVSKSGSTVIITSVNNNNATANNNNTNGSPNNHNNKVKSAQSFQNKSLKGTTRVSNPVAVKNGCLLAVAKETNKALLKQLKHNSRAFESLAILLSYCTNELDAFSTPHLKERLETERSKFIQAQSDIEELQSRLIRVREELNDKELVITELNNEKINLGEESENFRKLVEELRAELKMVTEQKQEAESELLRECENIRCLRRELSDRSDRFENEKDSLVNCLSEAKRENGILKSANREIKEEYDKCLVENQRLVELISKRQNEMVRLGKENMENESVKGRTRRISGDSRERTPERMTPTLEKSRRNSLTASPSVNPSCLESEVESLRQVLALKTDEVTELRRQELSLRENADRVPKLLSTITMLEGKVEDLQTQLSSQTETVRDLFKSNEHLEEELKSANIQKTRLTHKNEELQYKLKQYAEAMKQLATQKNLSEKSIKTEFSPLKANSVQRKTPSRNDSGNLDDSVKSQMKAVVEKSDSVSYMLEMTEDSSEIVTNIIRRAESLRSSNRDGNGTLPKKKRSKASSVSSTDTPTTKRNLSMDEDFRPELMSTPNSSPNESEFDRHMSEQVGGKCLHRGSRGSGGSSPQRRESSQPVKKIVKLNQDDFSTDSIELANDNDCEIIEITKSFDKAEKNAEMVTSTSSSASSISNGSHIDIESDVFLNLENEPNVHDLDEEDTENSEIHENGSIIRTFRRDAENIKPVLPVYTDLEPSVGPHAVPDMDRDQVQNSYITSSQNFVKIPKVSGGEAMIGLSSDDEDIDKIKRLCNE